MKIKLALLFGGKSVEHEISVISALQAAVSINREKYDVIPVYITKNNKMFTGDKLLEINNFKDIPSLLADSTQITFYTDGDRAFVVPLNAKHGLFSKKPQSTEIDVAFPVVHGTNVEDGGLQGFLKTLNLPFVGCDVLSSAVCMDKYVMKMLLKSAGVPVLEGARFSSNKAVTDIIPLVEEDFKYPVIVKPVNLGSSIGINVAKNRDELEDNLNTAFAYADTVLIERAVVNLREINVAVLGDKTSAEASECEEPIANSEILSFEDKYMSGSNSKSKTGTKAGNGGSNAFSGGKSISNGGNGGTKGGMASLSRKIPADLTPERREEIRNTAIKAFQVLDCCGVSRIDFIIDKDTDEFFVNELNTIPGSLSFYLWQPLGTTYPALIENLINLALKRSRKQDDITYTFNSNILSGNFSFGGSKG